VFKDLRNILDRQKLRSVYKSIAEYIIAHGIGGIMVLAEVVKIF